MYFRKVSYSGFRKKDDLFLIGKDFVKSFHNEVIVLLSMVEPCEFTTFKS